MRDSLKKHWLDANAGWTILPVSRDFPYADLIAVNSSEDAYILCIADGEDPKKSICEAIGRLALMMNRDVKCNIFGLPERDATLSPPLVRFVLATPDSRNFTETIREIPQRIRRLLNFVIVTVGSDSVTKYVETVLL